MNNALLIAHNITKIFTQENKDIIVLDTIEKTFTQGKTYAITGQSGAGKSTLIHILAGLEQPTHGTTLFNSVALHSLSSDKLAHHLNSSIGLVFQSPSLIHELSILENICLPGFIAKHTAETVIKKANALLEKVGIANKAHCKPGELSGGQQQRAVIARALINNPTFLLADEPTGNLDTHTSKAIVELLLECHKEWGMGIIISSHDPHVAHSMDEVLELAAGKLHNASARILRSVFAKASTNAIRHSFSDGGQAQDERIKDNSSIYNNERKKYHNPVRGEPIEPYELIQLRPLCHHKKK